MTLQQRIDDFLEERANAESDWDEQQSAFTDFVEMELQDQREMCAAGITKYAELRSEPLHDAVKKLAGICINAVERK